MLNEKGNSFIRDNKLLCLLFLLLDINLKEQGLGLVHFLSLSNRNKVTLEIKFGGWTESEIKSIELSYSPLSSVPKKPTDDLNILNMLSYCLLLLTKINIDYESSLWRKNYGLYKVWLQSYSLMHCSWRETETSYKFLLREGTHQECHVASPLQGTPRSPMVPWDTSTDWRGKMFNGKDQVTEQHVLPHVISLIIQEHVGLCTYCLEKTLKS